MGFIIEVGTSVNISDSRIGYDTPLSEYWDYYINPNNVSTANVSLSILEAVVKIEDITAEWKFGTFTLSALVDYPTWVLTNSTGWTTNTTTNAQKIEVTGASLPISIGEYIGLIVHANDLEYTYIGYKGSGTGTDSYVDSKNTTYKTTDTASKKVIGAIDVYGKYEYTHENTNPIPETSQSTGQIDLGDVYAGYGAIQLTDIQCTGTYHALFNYQTPWSTTVNSNVLESGESVTSSRVVGGYTEYYKITVGTIDCVNNDVTFTEQWWSDDGNRYVKTTGSDSALGTTWDVAWLTMGYGFQNIPSGKDLYVEEGLYGGETLSNLNPPQTMNMYIQPSGHTEAACTVRVFEHDLVSLQVNKDAYTSIKAPTTTFGAEDVLRTGDLQNDTDSYMTYLEFDLTTITDTSTIISSSLHMYGAGGNSPNMHYFKSVDAQFTENSITWDTAPAVNTDWATSKDTPNVGWWDLDVTPSYIESRLSSNWVGIRLSVVGYQGQSMRSKEYSSGSLAPYLLIEYV